MKITKTELKNLIKEALVEELGKKSSNRKIREGVSDNYIIEFTPDPSIWNLDFFYEDVQDYGENVQDYGESEYDSVAKYYFDKKLPKSDLRIKKIFILDPRYWDKEETEADVEEWIELAKSDPAYCEEFGFQLQNGDYLYTEPNHNIGPAYVKCRDYNSMINYVKNGIPNRRGMDAGDIIEESCKRKRVREARRPAPIEVYDIDEYIDLIGAEPEDYDLEGKKAVRIYEPEDMPNGLVGVEFKDGSFGYVGVGLDNFAKSKADMIRIITR